MAELTTKEVRQRIATALEARTGWRESPYVFDLFGREQRNRIHLSFAVGVPETSPFIGQGRQRRNLLQLVDSSISVVYTYQLHADNQVSTYDDMIDETHSAIKTVLGISYNDLHITWDSTNRKVENGFYFVTINFIARHQITLS